MNILQSIFNDYYEHILYELKPRSTVIENVYKMIHCGDHSYGGAFYACPHCGELKFVPFRCKSRFYPTCGNMYNQLRSFHMSSKLVACVLHTFGRDLKWNPHIHALISEGGTGNITPWRVVKHFDYTFLRNAFRKVLLEKLTNKLGKSFTKIKNEIYRNHADGFYVRAKPNLCTPDYSYT